MSGAAGLCAAGLESPVDLLKATRSRIHPARRDYVIQEDMVKAARKLTEAKSHESSAEYGKNI